MHPDVIQIALATAFAFWTPLDSISFNTGLSRPVMSGFVIGLILGDPVSGLMIGGTLQLLILGIGTFGGSSIPDFNTGAMIATIAVVTTGTKTAVALALAVPLGLLLVQLDILARFANSFFLHRALRCAERGDIDAVCRLNLLGIIPWGLSRAVPVLLFLLFGDALIGPLNKYIAEVGWLTSGFKVAAGLLPAVGFAILLRYMNAKKHAAWLLIGFVLAAYFKAPVVCVAILGLAAGMLLYSRRIDAMQPAAAAQGGAFDDE